MAIFNSYVTNYQRVISNVTVKRPIRCPSFTITMTYHDCRPQELLFERRHRPTASATLVKSMVAMPWDGRDPAVERWIIHDYPCLSQYSKGFNYPRWCRISSRPQYHHLLAPFNMVFLGKILRGQFGLLVIITCCCMCRTLC